MIRTPLFESPRYATLHEALFSMAASYGERPAITWYDRAGAEHTRTYRELLCDAAAFAFALKAEGFVGKRVAIASENSYEWLYMFFGITASGSTAVMVDVEQPEEGIAAAILHSGAALGAVSRGSAAAVAKAFAGRGPRLMTVGSAGAADSVEVFTDSGGGLSGEDVEWLRTVEVMPDDVAAIAFTSGTSGKPKAVMLTQKGLALNASSSIAMVKPSARVFSALPMYHTYGLTCGAVCILFAGAELGISGDIKRMERDFHRFDAEILMAVPLMVEMIFGRIARSMEAAGKKRLLQRGIGRFRMRCLFGIRRGVKYLEEIKARGVGRLTTVVCGGAHLSKTVADCMAAFGIQVLEGYGITECSPLVSVNRVREHVPHSVGLVLPGYEVRIERGGEILVSGEMLMKGYLDDPEATAAAMDGEWFKTGDIGFMDAKGFLHITGRKKSLIVLKNGKKTSPEEIESYISGMPLVKEVIAHGAQSGESADDVKIAVTVYPDPIATADMTQYEVLERLQRYVDGVNSRLPAYKQIQMVNLSSGELEKTAGGKLKR